MTHSRRQVKAHHEPIVSVTKSRRIESLTIGKMPGSQIIIYDKLAEVKAKRNFAWFKIWGLDRCAEDIHIKRIEIRAAKDALKANDITSLEEFESRIGAVLKRLVATTRYVQAESKDSNIARRENHPLWNRVITELESGIFSANTDICRKEIETVMKQGKAEQYMAQIEGNLMGLAVCFDIPFENILDVNRHITNNLTAMMREGSDKQAAFAKKYSRAQDRLRF